ncbi:hypothetical protein LTR28_009182, partial [Elasticomyces elasticus]
EPAPEDSNFDFANSKYELRPSRNNGITYYSWIDDDKTGDYYPVEKKRRSILQKRRPYAY